MPGGTAADVISSVLDEPTAASSAAEARRNADLYSVNRSSGMPPVAIAAGITGVTGLIGAGINAHQQNKAAAAQSKANEEALAFEKEREAYRQKQYENALQMYQASRATLAKHYGIDIAGAGLPVMPQGGPAGAPGGAPPQTAIPRQAPPPQAALAQPVPQQSTPDQTNLAALIHRPNTGDVFDWRNQGLM